MGVVSVQRAKANVYAITVGDEHVARKILEGNPWFIRDYTFSVKFWPSYHSLDDIEADRAIYWIQAHGIPRNYCTEKNARSLGTKIGKVLEVEDPAEVGFRGFLRIMMLVDPCLHAAQCHALPEDPIRSDSNMKDSEFSAINVGDWATQVHVLVRRHFRLKEELDLMVI
ncbi:hypothetical protein ACFX2G_022946 [Malus domestica]